METKQAEKLNGKIITKIKNRIRVQTFNSDPSQTEQQFKDDADANHIMAKYLKDPTYDPFIKKTGIYADVSQVPDLAQALETVTQAQASFDALPSDLRAKFGNSPVQMVEFLRDPKNTEEAIKLGLVNKPEEPPKPVKVEITNPTPSPTPSEKK